jgi:CheY-like chemotaxis protein
MYDVVILDYHMPVMDGPTACKQIRELGFTGLIVGITGNASPADTEHFLACGANKVFVKPVNVEALNDAFDAFSDKK